VEGIAAALFTAMMLQCGSLFGKFSTKSDINTAINQLLTDDKL
jgi:hypothetical protein